MSKSELKCDCKIINETAVKESLERMLTDKAYDDISNFYKIMGDSTRCKIISALAEGEMCVGDIANVLAMTKSSISHQLSKMKESGVVRCRREGKEIYYALDDEHVAEIFQLTVEHMRHKKCEETK